MGRQAELAKIMDIANKQNVPAKKRTMANEFDKGSRYRTVWLKNKKTGVLKSVKGAGVFPVPSGWTKIREE